MRNGKQVKGKDRSEVKARNGKKERDLREIGRA